MVTSIFSNNCVKVFSRIYFKDSVQRKLRWVENGVNRSVGALDCGAGHSFVVLFRFHLGFAIFPFLVCTVKIIGVFWINRWSGASNITPLLNWHYIAATANFIGTAWHSALIGEAGERLPHLQAKRGKFVAPIQSFCWFFFMFTALRLLAEYESQNK